MNKDTTTPKPSLPEEPADEGLGGAAVLPFLTVENTMNLKEIKVHIMRHNPSAAYLGRLEMKAMTAEAERAGYFVPNLTAEPDLHRMKFCGCPLFQVDSESHAGFGQNAGGIARELAAQDSDNPNDINS